MVDFSQKFQFFQDIHLWPTGTDFDYEGWLGNFSGDEELELAHRILDFFVFFPDSIINQLFRTVVGRAGYYFKKFDKSWNEESFYNNCWYSYVPGEDPNLSDSGVMYTRKAKELLGIPQERLKSYDEMIYLLHNTSEPQNIILVDDFVGTGAQCDHAWNQQRFTGVKKLKEMVNDGGHRVVYSPLVVNFVGKMRIECTCPNLHLEYAYELGPEWNLFSDKCTCWCGDSGLYKAGTDLIREKCKAIGVTEEKGEISIKGFGGQGLALGFSNGIPDACPAFFFKEAENWVPLKVKHLKRG